MIKIKTPPAKTDQQRQPLVIGLVIFGGVSAQQALVQRREKNEFLAKQQKLEQIADKIAAANKPDSRTSSQSCQYSSGGNDFDKGTLYCKVQIILKYQQLSLNSASSVMQTSGGVVGEEVVRSYPVEGKVAFEEDISNKTDTFAQQILNNPKCGVTYKFPVSVFVRDLEMYITCANLAKAEYFPLEK